MRLSIIIPAYNEGRHLDAVVRRLYATMRAAEPSTEIIVVNNGSSDETPRVAQELAASLQDVRLVNVYPNEGYGNGILMGLAAATGDVVGWVHADDQSNPEDTALIYGKLIAEKYDLCKAVRVHRKEHPWRILQSNAYNWLFRLMFGFPFRDINGTPKVMTRSCYERAKLTSKEWFIDPELMLKARDMGMRIGEVEIVWNARNAGKSNVRLTTMLHFFKRMMQYRFNKTTL